MTESNTIRQAIEDLLAWERDAGTALPHIAEDIAVAELFGLLIDLETGGVADIERDPDEGCGIHLVEPSYWLAGLEAAGGGVVTIQWSMTPEEYFAGVGKERA